MRNTLGTTHECSPENFPPTDETSDVADNARGTRRGDKLGTTGKKSEQPPQLQIQPAS